MRISALLILLLCLTGSVLSAGEVNLDKLLDGLSAPAAIDRANARIALIEYKGLGLNWRLKDRWKDEIFNEQTELLAIAKGRGDEVLLEECLDWTDGENRPYAIDYILSLGEDQLEKCEDKRIPRLLVLKAIYEFTKFTLAFENDHSAIGPGNYDILKRKSKLIYRAAFAILHLHDWVIEPINLAREYLLDNFEMNDEDELRAPLEEAREIIHYKKYEKATDYYDGVYLLRWLQIDALKAIRYSGMTEYTKVLRTLSIYYATPYVTTSTIHYALMPELFGNCFAASLYMLGDKKPYQTILDKAKDKIDADRKAFDDANIELSTQLNFIYSVSAMGRKYMLAEMYAEAEEQFNESIKLLVEYQRLRNPMMLGVDHYLRSDYYDRACCLANQLKNTAALKDLKRVGKMKYVNWKWLVVDPDLHMLSLDDRFRKWLEDTAPPSDFDAWKKYNEDNKRPVQETGSDSY